MTKHIVPSSQNFDANQPQVAPLDPELMQIFGSPPLLPSESLDEYNGLHDRVRRDVMPSGVIEEIWVRDFVDLTWEIFRLRRQKAQRSTSRAHRGLWVLLEKLVPRDELSSLVGDWVQGKEIAIQRVEKLMTEAGFNHTTLDAETLSANLDEIERFNRMIIQAEGRRNVVLREVDRRRDIARRLREVVADIEDAEFEEVSRPALEPGQ